MKRSGFTLIEMVISLTAGSMVMLAAVSLIHNSMHLRKQHQITVERMAISGRMLERWRLDVNHASRLIEREAGLEIEASGSFTVYRAEQGVLYRQQSVSGERTIVDSVDFGPGARCELKVITQPVQAAVLTIFRRSKLAKAEPQIERQIVATVGRCNKFSPNVQEVE